MIDDMLTPQSLFVEPPRRERITAISAAAQRRPIVLLLGMHRSGTSLCSHVLSALGVDMADKISGPGNMSSPDSSNPRGHWERWEIVEFHDRILGLFNRDYLGRFHDFALPVAWWADPRVAEIRREIIAFLEKRMGAAYFGFKDPRSVRLMPVWHQIFNELKLAPRLVLCLRNPAQVARSLNARDGLNIEIGEYRWLIHVVDFFRYASNCDFCTVEYEGWFNDPSANIEKLRKFLALPWQQSQADLGLVLSGIIDPALRHDDSDHREPNLPLARTLYKLARDTDQDQARDKIGYIVSQFIGFQQLQRPFQQAFEDVAKTAAKYPAIEQEAAVLRAALTERDAIVQATAGRAAAAEAILAERETALAELSRGADELRAALQAAQTEVATREAAIRRADQEAEERAAAAGTTQAEVVTLREALVRAERAERERAASGEALQIEVWTLREALAQAQRTGQERAAAAETTQAEVVTLRGALVQAERERAAQERAVAAADLQAEIVALQGTLVAARQVGRAAIAAFRIDLAAPAKPDRQPGMVAAIMRFFGSGRGFSSG
jgi:hypothetical protein